MPAHLIIGPPVNRFTRTAAEAALRRNPSFPTNAEVDMAQHEGHWIAAIAVAAEPPFAGGGPADASEEAPGPKSEGPDDTEPSADDSGPEEGGGEEKPAGPPKEHGEHGAEGKEQGELHHLQSLLEAIAAALGVSPDMGMGGDMIPGMDAGGPAGPPMPPPPHGGPPTPPPHGGPPPGGPAGPMGPGGPNEHVIHEKAGPPPVPTFSAVIPDDHPWKVSAVAPHFRVSAPLGEDVTLAEVEPELQALAAAGGFNVARIREEKTEDGQRVAAAIIASPKPQSA